MAQALRQIIASTQRQKRNGDADSGQQSKKPKPRMKSSGCNVCVQNGHFGRECTVINAT